MTTEPVLLSAEDGIARIRFNRPERLNAMDMELVAGFARAVETVLADDVVRVIVVAAEGRAFVAGGDLTFFDRAEDRGAAAHELIGPMHAALKALVASPKLTVGSLKGPVAGAGMSLALSFDFVVAADNTVLNLAYARIGTVPDCGGSYLLPRLIGSRRALELALLSDSVDAAEALRLGLVNRVVPLDELEAETERLATRLAKGATIAMGRTKLLMQQAFDTSFADQLDAEENAFADCAQTEDFGGAVSAFLQKRPYTFTGR
jgi:2-(1,2-epoxy-1,2-dihydrophenyl)acetyl-CoA isomerase